VQESVSRGSRDAGLRRRARWWEYATTIWNTGEVFVTIGLGIAAHSLALIAFGLDSCVEVFASVVVLWHLGGDAESVDPGRARRAMRLIGSAFGVVAVYLAIDAVRGLVTHHVSESSPFGMGFMAATVGVMLVLAWGKRRTGLALSNRPLVANATMTFIDGCLAGGILVALALNTVLGWWWADPLAAGIVAVIAANEAREAWTNS
jgi:divalent metal cation (Fe/Co/Zn/Cd) transporter